MAPNVPSTRSRVAEYVDEHIQTAADLQTLDSLIKNLRQQQERQQQQLREAEVILDEATEASKLHSETVRKHAEAFAARQEDINKRLMEVTQSKTSDEAIVQFEARMEKLRRLDVAKGYMDLLSKVNSIGKNVLSVMKSSPSDALQSYVELKTISASLESAQIAAEGAAPHLVNYVSKLAINLKATLQKEYSDNLRAVLEKMKWPAKDLQADVSSIDEWTVWVDLLLQLQEPDVVAQIAAIQDESQHHDPPILLPVEVMVYPLDLRFKYHFGGDRPTNRLDKPEYFLSHIIDLINTYDDFFMVYLQPVFHDRSQKCDPRLFPFYANAVFSYIAALMPMARQKVDSLLPHIANQPQLLSHLIHELMQFDNDVRETWGYSPAFSGDKSWKGLTWEVLVKKDWFSQWLQVEKDFALSRYQDIIDAADSGEIDFDGVDATATKPTKAAIRVNDLLETITDRYRPLSSFSQKLRFLIDIQITIFDHFHERLHSGLEAYLAMTSTIGRTVQGSSAGQLNLEGIAGLERLCRIFGSAEYLEKKMQDWSDDVFFLELWYELQDRVDQNTRTGRPVAGSMSVSEVAARTSSSVTDNNSGPRVEGAEGVLFDETSAAYRRIRVRSESIIVSSLTSNMQNLMRPYSRISTWASPMSVSEAGGFTMAPSAELASFGRSVSTELEFLSRVLGSAPLKRIARQLMFSIQTFLWDTILMRNSFSMAGATQFSADVEHICSTVDEVTGVPQGQFEARKAIQRLDDGLALLRLKIKPRDSTNAEGTSSHIGLWEVEKRLFASNESAREVLKQLEIEFLTESQARSVLERRVELRS